MNLPVVAGIGWPFEQPRLSPSVSAASLLPRITIVTPSYNQGRYVEATLRSVLLQGYPNLEYIVMDGGSSDRSAAIIESYAPFLSHWRSAKDAGQSDAIASGFEMATGEIFGWLNSDDILLPGALSTVARAFELHPRADAIYGNRFVIDEEGGVTGRHIWPRILTAGHWWLGQPMAQECTFWRSSAYEAVGGLDRSRTFTMDHDLFVRMWRRGKFEKTAAYLGCLRIHSETKNSLLEDVWRRELSEARVRYGLAEPGPLRRRFLNRFDRVQLFVERLLTKDVSPSDYGLRDLSER